MNDTTTSTPADTNLSESVEIVQHWPALDPDKEEWEIVSPNSAGVTADPVVTFDRAVIESGQIRCDSNPKILHHAQSSPDLRAWVADDKEDDYDEETTSSAVLVEEDPSFASSSMDLISGPPSVWSTNSTNKLSFKEILKQKPKQQSALKSDSASNSPSKPAKKASFKAKFVVVEPHSQKTVAGIIRNSKSMGNLRALDHIQEEDDVLGDTDAELFYNQKSMGAKGRANGQKIRPDEAKRLEITMNKKNLQKQRQRG